MSLASIFRTPAAALSILAPSLLLLAMAGAQEPTSRPQDSPSGGSPQSQPSTPSQKPAIAPRSPNQGRSYNFGAELAKETREAAGEDDTAEFKRSPAVRWVARHTGMSLEHAYWLALVLNFGAVAAVIAWAGKKLLPGMLRERTASIQKAMEEARKASAEANRRLNEIEARLSRLGVDIEGMRSVAEKEAQVEEERIKAAAEEGKRKIIASAEQEIAAAAKQARRELTAHAADLAVSLAQRQIRVDPATDQALVRHFAQQLTNHQSNHADKKDKA
jgi:F-type H+-transporting ATPase subunit b